MHHTYLSGITHSLKKHFEETASYVNDTFFKNKKIKKALDIGSNDGSQLEYYKDLGFEVVGVEPSSNIAAIANKRNIFTICDFFNLSLAQKINCKFDVINASGVFFHLEELHSVTEGIKSCLNEDGIFVVQFIYMKKIVENIAFDQIYHEHLLYYTLSTLNKLLNIYDLELFDACLSNIHGGSIIGFVSHKNRKKITARLEKLYQMEEQSNINNYETYVTFARNVALVKEKNLNFLHECKQKKKKVFGRGAPVKGNTLLNYLKIDTSLISFLVEKNELRKGMYSPGMHIPILLEKDIFSPPDVYYVLAWNFKNEILKNNKQLIEKGVKFYFPIEVRN